MDASERKLHHINTSSQLITPPVSSLLDEVFLLNDPVHACSPAAVDISTKFLGRVLKAPIIVSSMTGGIPEAATFNLALARMCVRHAIPMALGSLSPYLRDHDRIWGFDVKKSEPDLMLGGNIGAIAAADLELERLNHAMEALGLDFMFVHLNPLHELAQPEGDRHLHRAMDGIKRLLDWGRVPVLVKEVGFGLSKRSLDTLKESGVIWVDVAGSGGTSFLDIELSRPNHPDREVLEPFRTWGIPTAPAVMWAKEAGLRVIGSGGVRTGLDVARLLALGAQLAGVAAPWLRAWQDSGEEGMDHLYTVLETGLRYAMALAGAGTIKELQHVPRVLGDRLAQWV